MKHQSAKATSQKSGGETPKTAEARFAYRVKFNEPPEAGYTTTEFFFASLSAIYRRFYHRLVGCRVSTLWNARVAQGAVYRNRKCLVERIEVGYIPRQKIIKAK